MTTWDLGAPRWSRMVEAAAVPMVAGADLVDRLYPLWQQQQIADLVPGTVGGLRVISTPIGHDGFLVERDEVFALVHRPSPSDPHSPRR